MEFIMKNKCLALIPARGGSKRIPDKNIIDFCGKPIISYSIKAAYKSKLFDSVMVSTNSKKIASISTFCGATVPFLRSKENSNDNATLHDVVKEVINNYKKMDISFKYICVILATNPLIQIKNIINGFKLMKKDNYDTILPLVPFSSPIQKAFKIENNKIEMIQPENKNNRSQDLPISYKDAGQFYWINNTERKTIIDNRIGGIMLSELEAQDIDNPIDLAIVKIKYKILSGDKYNENIIFNKQ